MSSQIQQIRDYLQTQALKLQPDLVAIAQTTAQAVLSQTQAHIDAEIWQHADLPHDWQEVDLKKIFMALDSAYARNTVQTAVVYALYNPTELVRVAQIGKPIENMVSVNESSAWRFLAARTAQSGWANILDNVEHWLQLGELLGEHNRRAVCQTSLPICGEDGAVYGVLHLEHDNRLPEEALADWVGLVLGLLPVMRDLCPKAEIF